MNAIIDLSVELLVDRSRIQDPHLRLLLTSIGEELVQGSPWIDVNKKSASQDRFASQLMKPRRRRAAAICA